MLRFAQNDSGERGTGSGGRPQAAPTDDKPMGPPHFVGRDDPGAPIKKSPFQKGEPWNPSFGIPKLSFLLMSLFCCVSLFLIFCSVCAGVWLSRPPCSGGRIWSYAEENDSAKSALL